MQPSTGGPHNEIHICI